jgi:chemotaxis protein histidine kinase CheA
MAFDHAKFLARFIDEAREHCSRLSEGLLNLESSPGDAELVNALFRSAHTIKGSSRMMKLGGVTELAHRMEDVLDAVRGGSLEAAPPVCDVLFRGLDALGRMLEAMAGGEASPEAPAELCRELAQTAQPAPEANAPVSDQSDQSDRSDRSDKPEKPDGSGLPQPQVAACAAPEVGGALEKHPAAAKDRPVEYLRINAAKLDDLIKLMGEIVSQHNRYRRDIASLREIERSVARHLKTVSELSGTDSDQQALAEAGGALQLSLRQAVRGMQDASLLQEHLVGDLQQSSLTLRMQPLSTVFDPLRRTVRDLAHEVGKEVDFVVDGGDTELDRKIIDRIGDSLLHMIRNSLDHGLESGEERSAAGKPAKGTIALSAYYDSGCVTISLSDDGKGLSADKIGQKALAKGLLTESALQAMSRAEVTNLIFLPGFSTSPIITDISGRGVGMDVVRKSVVDELRGSIVIETREGEGTTFLLRLPLNLAVFPLFLLSVGGKTCALPATSMVEMLSIRQEEIIDIVNKRAIRLREQIIPVEELAAIVGVKRGPRTGCEVTVVVIRDGEEKLGLLVDAIVGREEMVVKSLPRHLKELRLVSGATIGERDSIINVLHPPEIIRLAREIAQPRQRPHGEAPRKDSTVLVVDDSINTRELEQSLLEAYGYKVVTAEDGEDAWLKSRGTRFDLVITDVEMPRLDGFSLTERLRSDPEYGGVPVIIVTSREKVEDKKRGIAVGANAYIVKGAFDQSNLLDTVRSLIG